MKAFNLSLLWSGDKTTQYLIVLRISLKTWVVEIH